MCMGVCAGSSVLYGGVEVKVAFSIKETKKMILGRRRRLQ